MQDECVFLLVGERSRIQQEKEIGEALKSLMSKVGFFSTL
jgi:hypothetical protein